MFCKSSAKVCQNSAILWQKFNKNLSKVWQKFCKNSAKILQKFYKSSAKVLQKFYKSSAKVQQKFSKVWQKFCKNSSKVLQKFITFFHIFIHDYASPGLNLFNLVSSWNQKWFAAFLFHKSCKNPKVIYRDFSSKSVPT